ncbi:Vitamin B12 import ATP-binding protein BtuD [anaerobic digester metagenome]
MPSDIAIRVNGLGKKYRIAHETASYKTLGETLTRAVKAPFRRLTGEASSRSTEEFWALKDVSFEVKRGEVVGIIGRNGAGKSTLLKILSRITTPTEGTVEVHGRIGSLLEVGTGFHPELSGRENIYLSGSILGMKRSEIDAKFDEIVKFAEMEKFLDTPVKRYSSGMYVRLAFAVAAHLEPEILIVDEVLAVGDAAFQKKCLGKMGDVARLGRTVLFVSHNMQAVTSLCTTGILLKNGEIAYFGNISDTIKEYYDNIDQDQIIELNNHKRDCPEYGTRAIIKDVITQKINKKFHWRENIVFRLSFLIIDRSLSEVDYGIGINNYQGTRIVTYESEEPVIVLKNEVSIEISIKNPKLIPGKYSLAVGIRSSAVTLDYIQHTLQFEVSDFDQQGNIKGFYHGGEISGYIEPEVTVCIEK